MAMTKNQMITMGLAFENKKNQMITLDTDRLSMYSKENIQSMRFQQEVDMKFQTK